MLSPDRIQLPTIPVHKTEAGEFDPTAVVWHPPNKKQPGKVIVDETVQRDFREKFAKDISARWNPALANPVHISVRKDRTEAVIDGQHTTWAAQENEVTALHCIRHWGLSLSQEAAFHLQIQSDRKADSAGDKWSLRVVADIPEYVEAKEMLARHGLVVGSHIRAAGAVDYVVSTYGSKTLENVVLTMNAWSASPKATREDWTANAVIRALGYLFGHHPMVAEPVQLGRKLQKKTTPVAMGGQIASVAKGGGGSGSRTTIGAKLIADIWNTRRAPANQFPVGVLGVIGSDDEEEELEED